MSASPLYVEGVTVGPLEENCWILHDPASGEVAVVDPGAEPARIVARVRARLSAAGAAPGRLVGIWLTHAHFDHIGGVEGLRREWPGTPVHLHPADRPVYDFGARAAAAWEIPFEMPGPPDRTLGEGDKLAVGAHRFTVRHLPGHSPGHVAFLGDGLMIGGDVLFAGSVGRTDLPLSDPDAFDATLRRVAAFPPVTRVLPGHGPETTIGAELAANPFLNGMALVPRRRGEPPV